MITIEELRDLLAEKKQYTDTDRLLIVLSFDAATAKPTKRVNEIAETAGWRAVKRKNASQLLGQVNGKCANTAGGWILTSSGRLYVDKLIAPYRSIASAPSPAASTIVSLRKHAAAITTASTRQFVEDAVECCHAKLFRAAVVFSWVGAVAVLYDYVIADATRLASFNMRAKLRNPKWVDAVHRDDLARMKESEFLDTLADARILGSSIRDSLQSALKTRNGCGHPNSFAINELAATAHVETLIDSVFARFA